MDCRSFSSFTQEVTMSVTQPLSKAFAFLNFVMATKVIVA